MQLAVVKQWLRIQPSIETHFTEPSPNSNRINGRRPISGPFGDIIFLREQHALPLTYCLLCRGIISSFPPGIHKCQILSGFFSIGKICSPSSLWCSLHRYVFSPRQCKEILFKSSEDMSAEIDRIAMYPWSTLAISEG